MSASHCRIRLRALWIGSNKPVCPDFELDCDNVPMNNARGLQTLLARQLQTEPESVKAVLSASNGPELTPVLPKLWKWRTKYKAQILSLEATWTSLLQTQCQCNTLGETVAVVFVTQHRPSNVAVAALITAYRSKSSGWWLVHPVYNKMSYELRSTPEVAIAAFDLGVDGLPNVPRDLLKNKQFILNLLAHEIAGFLALAYADETLKDNKEVVLASIEANSCNFKHASLRLREDNEVCFAAFQKWTFNLHYAGPLIRGNKETMMRYIDLRAQSFKYAMPALKADKDVVMAAVSKLGVLLQHAAPEMQADVDVVQAAVANDQSSIEYALTTLQSVEKHS